MNSIKIKKKYFHGKKQNIKTRGKTKIKELYSSRQRNHNNYQQRAKVIKTKLKRQLNKGRKNERKKRSHNLTPDPKRTITAEPTKPPPPKHFKA